MTTASAIEEAQNPFAWVAGRGLEFQAWRERFMVKERRPADHPSRIAWVTANNLWQASTQAKTHKLFFNRVASAAGPLRGVRLVVAAQSTIHFRKICL